MDTTAYEAVRPKNNPLLWVWDVLNLLWEDGAITTLEYSDVTKGWNLEE